MNNQINGISPSNKNLGMYMEAGRGVAGYLENQISNEILYWRGNQEDSRVLLMAVLVILTTIQNSYNYRNSEWLQN